MDQQPVKTTVQRPARWHHDQWRWSVQRSAGRQSVEKMCADDTAKSSSLLNSPNLHAPSPQPRALVGPGLRVSIPSETGVRADGSIEGIFGSPDLRALTPVPRS